MVSGPTLRVPDVPTKAVTGFRGQMGNVSRQALIFFAGTVFTTGAGYLFKIYLARTLGPEPLGLYALGMTMVGFLGMLNALGLSQAAVRFVASYFATGRFDLLRGFIVRCLGLLVAANIFLGIVLLTAGPFVAVRFYHSPVLTRYLWYFALVMLLGGVNGFLSQTLTGYGDVVRRTTINSFIGQPMMMAITFVLLTAGLGLKGYLSAQIAGSVIVCGLLAAAVWKLTPDTKPGRSRRFASLERQVFAFSFAAFGVGLLEFLISQSDVIMLGYFRTARELGVYAIATALVAFVPIILQSVNQIFAPTIAALYAKGEHALLARMYQTTTKWILGLTLPLAAAMILFARPLMAIFGREFAAGWFVVIAGTLGQVINCGVGSVGFLLLMTGHQNQLVRVQAITVAIMLTMNAMLIPRWGIGGAAIASSLAGILSNVLALFEVRKRLHVLPYNRGYLRLLAPLAATACVLAVSHWLFQFAAPSVLKIGAVVLLGYIAFLGTALLWGLDDDDKVMVMAVRSRLNSAFQSSKVPA